MNKILIIGKNGQVGHELRHGMAFLGEVTAIDFGEIDLADEKSIRDVIQSQKPDILINAAAYTQVDKAEEEKDIAMAINATAPKIMAEEMSRGNGLLVHYSTDFVFDGQKKEPYLESDPSCPINVYGETKLAGDEAIQRIGCNHYILRTSWVYGLRGKNFLLTMLKFARERDQLTIIDDQVGSPTWSRAISDGTVMLCHKWLCSGEAGQRENIQDLINFNAEGQTSWHGFAKAIFELAQASDNPCLKLDKNIDVKAIPTKEYPTPAQRPLYSVLSKKKLNEQYGLYMPDWKAQLELCMR